MTMKNIFIFLVFNMLFSFATNTYSAEIKITKNPWGDKIIVLQGKIERGDYEKIKKASLEILNNANEYSKPLHLHLNTEGGDVNEAIKIGRFAREVLLSVDSYGKIIIDPSSEDGKRLLAKDTIDPDYVLLDKYEKLSSDHIVKNYSAGIIIFYGAVKRAHRDNSDQRLGFYKKYSIPVIGLHRPSFDQKYYATLSPSKAASEYKKLESSVREYLLEMGSPQSVLDDMFRYASNDVKLIEDYEFRKMYKGEESFLEEWLISRCGASGHYNDVLSVEELDAWPQIEKEQVRLLMKDTDKEFDSSKIYESQNYEFAFIKGILEKIRKHNRTVGFCREKAVINHQISWAKRQVKPSSE
jgi:hypothetical protein